MQLLTPAGERAYRERFQIRWNNGFYKIFDAEKYQDVPTHRRLTLRREAEKVLAEFVAQ